jgi:hypothetical protein
MLVRNPRPWLRTTALDNGIRRITMLLAELGAPIEDLMKKISETWRRL